MTQSHSKESAMDRIITNLENLTKASTKLTGIMETLNQVAKVHQKQLEDLTERVGIVERRAERMIPDVQSTDVKEEEIIAYMEANGTTWEDTLQFLTEVKRKEARENNAGV